MFAPRFIPGALITAAALFAVVTPTPTLLPLANAKSVTKKGHHLDSLHAAAHELKHAHSATSGKNGGTAASHVSAAIGHIEKAIESHKTNHLNQTRSGLSGLATTAAHHHHHNQLQEALHAAKSAQKHLTDGNIAKAKEEITKAHHHVELAIHQHHSLIGS